MDTKINVVRPSFRSINISLTFPGVHSFCLPCTVVRKELEIVYLNHRVGAVQRGWGSSAQYTGPTSEL